MADLCVGLGKRTVTMASIAHCAKAGTEARHYNLRRPAQRPPPEAGTEARHYNSLPKASTEARHYLSAFQGKAIKETGSRR